MSDSKDWTKLSVQAALYAGSTVLVTLLFVMIFARKVSILGAISNDKLISLSLIGLYSFLGALAAFGLNKSLPSEYQYTMFAVPASSADICMALKDAKKMDFDTCFQIATERQYRFKPDNDYSFALMQNGEDNLNML